MKTYTHDTVIVGSGCAGLACAARLYAFGQKDVVILTDGRTRGTSRNAGSDKQTYYKLSMAADDADSVGAMARDLFRGGGVHGETALLQAAFSPRAFLYLVELGVPFPANAYGEYVGYKTDHDPRQRATSAGPLTSWYMAQALERQTEAFGIEMLQPYRAVELLHEGGRVCGLLCVHVQTGELLHITCRHVVLATGGQANIYENSVFPESQSGALGLAARAGVLCANLNQWQYGIAAAPIRWNLSGSYQQALPRYVRLDANGKPQELLPAYYPSPAAALNDVFLKGYQWPFDVRKARGSSKIDLIVSYETMVLGNRVFLDYTAEPSGLEDGFACLDGVCTDYLRQCGALVATPYERLVRINPQSADFFARRGLDLKTKLLEINVCAQHQNGGVAVDANWRSELSGLYAVGEAAGTFGAYRPGGSALNATQVGALLAAQDIARRAGEAVPACRFEAAQEALESLISRCLQNKGMDHMALRKCIQRKMSRYAGHLRDKNEIAALCAETAGILERFETDVSCKDRAEAAALLETRDMLYALTAILPAMLYAAEHVGSTGSALLARAEDVWNTQVECESALENSILLSRGAHAWLEKPREIPARELWFERVYRNSGQYAEHQ